MISSELERSRVKVRYADTDPIVIPNAVDIPDLTAAPKDGGLLFVGGFDHFPNLDAALWLCKEIWPRLARIGPTSERLTIIGHHPPPWLSNAASQAGIDLRNDVADLAPFYRHATLAVAPLRAGGGTRLKLLEAAAWSLPAVSTSIGAEGLDLVDGRHLWVADDADGFAAACLEALTRPDERNRRGAAAREVVSARYDWRKVAGQLAALLSHRLGERTPGTDAARSLGTAS
jgi:glycosyltransferase involved in cell wall biosynthesis